MRKNKSSGSGSIYRKVALDRVSSPEQLDQLMSITRPVGWLTLAAIGGLMVCAVLWSILGNIPVRLDGQGILMKIGGVYSISCRDSGRVKSLFFGVGDRVQAGQMVAVIGQPEILDKITDARDKVRQIRIKYHQTKDFSTRELSLNDKSFKQQSHNFRLTNQALKKRLSLLEEQLRDQEKLVKMGLITRQKVISTEQEINTGREQFRNNENQIKELTIKELQLENQISRNLLDLEDQLTTALEELQDLEDNLSEDAYVLSPFTGEILGLNVEVGDMVQPGSSLMTAQQIGPDAGYLEAVMFFPSRGKEIKPGMTAQVTPMVVKKERYGSIIGLVTYVSPFPADGKAINRLLQNEKLTDDLSRKGASIEIRVALVPNSKTISGYTWTSSKGPPLDIGPGMLAEGTVIVERQPPIQLVIPLMKKYLLGTGEETDGGGI